MSNVDCAACADPRGDATCAACCQEGAASDAASLARQLRAIANMPARLARERLLAWASECDDTEREAVEAVRELRDDQEWQP